MTWQPIETAPKDGRLLLLLRGVLCYGYFFKGDDGSSGWITSKIGRNADPMMSIEDPTHWMPLPKPPAVSDKR